LYSSLVTVRQLKKMRQKREAAHKDETRNAEIYLLGNLYVDGKI
jgi:hypothetical protein